MPGEKIKEVKRKFQQKRMEAVHGNQGGTFVLQQAQISDLQNLTYNPPSP